MNEREQEQNRATEFGFNWICHSHLKYTIIPKTWLVIKQTCQTTRSYIHLPTQRIHKQKLHQFSAQFRNIFTICNIDDVTWKWFGRLRSTNKRDIKCVCCVDICKKSENTAKNWDCKQRNHHSNTDQIMFAVIIWCNDKKFSINNTVYHKYFLQFILQKHAHQVRARTDNFVVYFSRCFTSIVTIAYCSIKFPITERIFQTSFVIDEL